MNSLGLSVNDVRSVMGKHLGLSAEDLGLILGSYQSSGSSATVPIIPPDSGYGGLTSAEIAEIIAAHGGFGGVMGVYRPVGSLLDVERCPSRAAC